MAASNTDKITDTRNAARPNSARVTSGRAAAGATLACDNLSGWPTASKVHFVTYKVDSSSAVVAGTQLDCYGIVSGNNIGSFTVVDGNDTGHAVGDYVEMLPTAAWGQDLADALTSTHNRSSGLKTGITLTQPTIADYTNAVHTHASSAQGGLLNAASAITAGTLTPAQLTAGAGSSWVWQSWTPALTNLAGGTQTYAKYVQSGKTVHFRFKYILAGAGISGAVTFSLPVAAHSDYANGDTITSQVRFVDSGVAGYGGFVQINSATLAQFVAGNAASTYFTESGLTSLIPFTWGNLDYIIASGSYEAA